MKNSIFEENRIITKNNKKVKWKLENILNENLYYKLYNQSNIIISFGNNSHCETGHSDYKLLYIPRVLYQLKNKEIISIKSGWEHNICQDKDKMLYSFGNNSRCQCGFDILDNNKIIKYPKNIMELNDKSINEISCGNEHTLALTEDGDVYSWGSTSDGVLGREIKGYEKALGIGKPGKIPFFIKNDIKIRHISSGSIHNLCLDFKSNLYSWGCSKGGQLGLDEKELAIIYKQNCLNNSNSKEKDK
jgi:alpha-tubulin suppressor-like RCC1 family protein